MGFPCRSVGKKPACHAGGLGWYAYMCPEDPTGRVSPGHRACRGEGKRGSSKALAGETAGSQQAEHRSWQACNIHHPWDSSGREQRLGWSSRAGAPTWKTAQPPPRPLEHLKIRSEHPRPGPPQSPSSLTHPNKRRPGGQCPQDRLHGWCSHRLKAEQASLRLKKLCGRVSRAGDPRLPHLQGSPGGPLPSALHLAVALWVQAEGPLSRVSLHETVRTAEWVWGEQVGALPPVVTEGQRAGI